MPDRTPAEAYRSLAEPIQTALNTITVGRLSLLGIRSRIPVGTPFNVSLNGGTPSPLVLSGGVNQLFIEVAFWARIEPHLLESRRYDCFQTAYWYALSNEIGRELIAYHWTPDVRHLDRRFPHLHVGRLVTSQSKFIPTEFHKLHVPTNLVSVQHLVRFAIQELGVSVRPGLNRNEVLANLNREIGDS